MGGMGELQNCISFHYCVPYLHVFIEPTPKKKKVYSLCIHDRKTKPLKNIFKTPLQ
jgi:hypothetical protein